MRTNTHAYIYLTTSTTSDREERLVVPIRLLAHLSVLLLTILRLLAVLLLSELLLSVLSLLLLLLSLLLRKRIMPSCSHSKPSLSRRTDPSRLRPDPRTLRPEPQLAHISKRVHPIVLAVREQIRELRVVLVGLRGPSLLSWWSRLRLGRR